VYPHKTLQTSLAPASAGKRVNRPPPPLVWFPSFFSHLGLFDELVHVPNVKVLAPAELDAGQLTAPDELSDCPRGDAQVGSDGLNVVQAAGITGHVWNLETLMG